MKGYIGRDGGAQNAASLRYTLAYRSEIVGDESQPRKIIENKYSSRFSDSASDPLNCQTDRLLAKTPKMDDPIQWYEKSESIRGIGKIYGRLFRTRNFPSI